jgi:hypothetical protein
MRTLALRSLVWRWTLAVVLGSGWAVLMASKPQAAGRAPLGSVAFTRSVPR